MNSNLSDRKLILIQEIFKLNTETSLAKIEKEVKQVRLFDDLANFKNLISKREQKLYDDIKKGIKIGFPISGLVTQIKFSKNDKSNLSVENAIFLNTELGIEGILPIYKLFDKGENFDEKRIPKVGSTINAIISGGSKEKIHLSARPSDFLENKLLEYRNYYRFIEQHRLGEMLTGIVKEIRDWGILVDLSIPFLGVIKVVQPYKFDSAKTLPDHQNDWPKVGETITGVSISYDFYWRQINLYWIE